MSVTERDFDRLALLDSEGWTHNNHYHSFILGHVPNKCQDLLESGCGTGSLARRLAARAQNVLALDLSSEMIRVARSHSAGFQNLQFLQADAMSWDDAELLTPVRRVPRESSQCRHLARENGALLIRPRLSLFPTEYRCGVGASRRRHPRGLGERS